MKKLLFALFLTLIAFDFAPLSAQISAKKYETRAAWLTTIYGLDWPSSTSPSSQRRELKRILDHLQDLGINTVFLQVRGRGDLIYPSEIEPVNPYFSEDGHLSYDPLKFAIDECRKRGMSIHAWVVAIPVGNRSNKLKLGNRHFAARHPGGVLTYNGTYYMDPADPRTTEHLKAISKELLNNYDLDGIHLDYIRYPENTLGKIDRKDYDRKQTPLSYEAWRRNNITKVVKGIHDTVHEADSLAQLSAAVIGTYKSRVPGYDEEIGWNAFGAVQQDPVQWAKEGAIDFIVPMLYRRGESFWPIIKQWKSVMDSIPVLIGIGAYRVLPNEGDWPDREILGQTTLVQADSTLMGMCYFRTDQIERPGTVRYRRLRDENFKKDALPQRPLSGLLDTVTLETAPRITELKREADGLRIKWEADMETPRGLFAVYASTKAENIDLANGSNLVLTTKEHETVLPWSAFGIESVDETKDYLLTVNVTNYDLHSGVETALGKGQVYFIHATLPEATAPDASEIRTGLPVPVPKDN
ncbi:MAG: family 10 glycosylhydrolase [Bacteroidales bacterium]|nr:family 10 glycosylhydrolase [Bacteroidales bacterium]